MIKTILKVLCLLLFALLSFSSVHAGYQGQVQDIYATFSQKLDAKYSQSQKIAKIQSLRDAAGEYFFKSTDTKRKQILYYLLGEIHEELYEYEFAALKDTSSQKLKELNYRRSVSRGSHENDSSVVSRLISKSGIDYIAVNESGEFVDGSKLYTIGYSQYYPVSEESYNFLSQKSGIIVYLDGTYRFIESYRYDEIFAYSSFEQKGYSFVSEDLKYERIGSQYYAYNFTASQYFSHSYGVNQLTLDTHGISKDSALIYKKGDAYHFVKQYTKTPIVEDSAVYGLANKHLILSELADDMRFPSSQLSQTLLKIQKESLSQLFSAKSEQDYIQSMYHAVLDHLSYTQNIDLTNMQIFSGIEGYDTASGVCTAYTKLLAYFLSYGQVDDIEIIRGYVFDAQDFPQIGHAWIRIDDAYYDPTFDDPIGGVSTRTQSEYVYYDIPRDILYANRYDYEDLPEYLKTASAATRDALVQSNLVKLATSYGSEARNYLVFAPVLFRTEYGISQTAQLTPSVLAGAIGSYTVASNSFRFEYEGRERAIKSYKYFLLTETNTEQVLSQLSYEVDDVFLFYWQTETGSYEWRLGYDVEL